MPPAKRPAALPYRKKDDVYLQDTKAMAQPAAVRVLTR